MVKSLRNEPQPVSVRFGPATAWRTELLGSGCTRSRRASVVIELGAQEVVDLLDLREVPERLAAQDAAHRATRGHLDDVRALVAAMEGTAAAPQRWAQRREIFHAHFAEFKSGQRLAAELRRIRACCTRPSGATPSVDTAPETHGHEQKGLVDARWDGDGTRKAQCRIARTALAAWPENVAGRWQRPAP